jgi:hypothetical protein
MSSKANNIRTVWKYGQIHPYERNAAGTSGLPAWLLLPGANDPGRYRVTEGWPTVGSAEGQRDHSVRYASPNKAPTVSATPVGCT